MDISSHIDVKINSYIFAFKIQYFCIFRIDSVPKSLHSVVKELFRMSVCLKPQLVHTGIERIKGSISSHDILSEEAVLGINGRFRLK